MYEGLLCTCCMATENLVDLFTPRKINNIEENYSKMLSCLNIQISQDDGHDSICEECISKLKDCIAFKRQTLRSISILTSVNITKLVTNPGDIQILGLEENEENMNGIEELNVMKDVKDGSQKTSNQCEDRGSQDENMEEESTSVTRKKGKRAVGRPRKHPKDKIPYRIAKDELQCRECGEEFPNNITLKVHYNSHFRNHVCNVCDKGFMTYTSLRKHKTSHLEGPFPCKTCKQVFSNLNTLHSHTRFKHTSNGFRCNACGLRFATFTQRLAHAEAAHAHTERRYPCEHCDKSFRYSGERSKHISRHHITKPTKCPLCSFQSGRDQVRVHLTRKHGAGRTSVCACAICGKRFSTRGALRVHVHTHIGFRKFVCKLCGKGFVQKCTLMYHIRSHIRRGEYSGDPNYLIVIKEDPGADHMGLLEETMEEENLDESLLSLGLDVDLDEDIEFLLDEQLEIYDDDND